MQERDQDRCVMAVLIALIAIFTIWAITLFRNDVKNCVDNGHSEQTCLSIYN